MGNRSRLRRTRWVFTHPHRYRLSGILLWSVPSSSGQSYLGWQRASFGVKDASVSVGPSLVCFDLGGVMVELAQGWDEACRFAGVPFRGQPGDEALRDELDRLHGTGRISDEHWADRLARASARYSSAELLRIHHAWIRREYEGIGTVVDCLDQRGVLTACLSNTTEGHWRRMTHRADDVLLAGPAEFPTVARLTWRLASHRLGLLKPDPAIFEAFAARTSVRGSDILFFDDLEPNVESARKCGWNAVRIAPNQPTAPQILAHLRAYGLVSGSLSGNALDGQS
jgi:glucose-1-phosphatase